MGNFLKGALLGTLAGVCIGAIVVAKNKKLSNKLKESIVTAEGKIKEIKQNLEESLASEGNCSCFDQESSQCPQESSENEKVEDKNQLSNFSKKNKNC